jgi:phage nucleotide-binding protein
MQIVKMSDVIAKDECLRALIYGPAGSGKTTLVGTFPTPMLIFDFDQKLKPLYGKEGIDVISYTMEDPTDATKIFNQFKRDFKEAKKDPKYKTLVLDSLTSFDTITLRHFVLLAGKGAEVAATLPVYGEQGSFYSFFFTDLKSVRDKHVLVTAHEFYNVDGESGLHSIQPLITGKSILGKLPAMFEEVYYLNKKGGNTDDVVLYYRPAKKAIATSLILSGGSGQIENPTFKKIVDFKSVVNK